MATPRSPTGTNDASGEIVQLLSAPSTYPDNPSSVEMIETHISWVFLTDRHAYKLKKPVRFEFLDFTTPALRRRACLAELELNRRLAPDVYLAVLPITRNSRGSLALAGAGKDVDWVVQMRRLDATKALDAALRRGCLTDDDARAVTNLLVGFCAGLAPTPITPDVYRFILNRHIRDNQATLLAALSPDERARVLWIVGAELRYLHVAAGDFDERVAAGRVVEGHGDLRPEHIYLERPPAVIDCIEFAAELRTVDIADELSFLAMECRRLGDCRLGPGVLAAYQSRCGDAVPERLLAFYSSYRACVRAKVAALRAKQEIESHRRPFVRLARQYVDWAEHHAAQLGRPALVTVGGLMGTGKSTLSAALADAYAAELLATDHVRRALLGASTSPAGYGQDNYLAESRDRVYAELLSRAAALVDCGRTVILDGTFISRSLRARAEELACRHGAVLLHVECRCPRHVSLTRLRERARAGDSESEARAELYDLQAGEYEPLPPDGAVIVDTCVPLTQQVQAVDGGLRRLLFG